MYRSSRVTRAPWVACDPNGPRVRRSCYPSAEAPPQIGHFSCAALRSRALAFLLQEPRFRGSSQSVSLVEAAGIEPASVAAPKKHLQA
jgi:hypothetical protein